MVGALPEVSLALGVLTVFTLHTISCPSSEGRHNFFSLLFCYWEKAPEVNIAITNVVDDNLTWPQIVVYDFARALGHHSIHREPESFSDTRCVLFVKPKLTTKPFC